MDFFAHQDQARKNSRRFVMLYTTSVVLICLAVGILFGIIGFIANDSSGSGAIATGLVFGGIAAGVSALVILGGSAYRINDLRGGGSSVARALGGIQVDPSTRNKDERRVLNVVEEMAIASGVPVPPVYMMPGESRINAFAAGYAPGDAVIGVTKGCVEGLTRDELQGVMAHEFSHILNGDMRLNIRMIGFLNGILIITIAGRILLEVAPRTGRGKEGAAAMLTMFIIAIVLMIIGSVGALSARIIQSAVSRQREYLADASAVQFTRNPDGIGNALRRIGGSAGFGRIKHPRAQEAGHIFFGQALKLSATLSTHPPLKERITRVMPSWDGTYLTPLIKDERAHQPVQSPADKLAGKIEDALGGEGILPGELGGIGQLMPMLALSGTMTPKHLEHAQGLIDSIPQSLRDASHEAYSGRAVVYALLLDRKDKQIRDAQLDQLDKFGDMGIAKLVRDLMPDAITIKREQRLPVLDMTLGSLAGLSETQHATFRKNVDALVKMDKSIDLFEWMTMNTLRRHLDERFELAKQVPVQYYNLNRLGREVSVLLSMLAHTGAKDDYAAGEAVLMGESAVRGIGVELLAPDVANLRALDSALKTLNQCSGRVKKQLLHASALVVGADHEIMTNEAELLRAVADSLGVPTPPLLPGQKLV
jgi:Zn-dependent protease with chaperone function